MSGLQTRIPARIYVRYNKFFRSRLLVLDSDGISQMVDSMEKETKTIRTEIIKLCWYMRGGVTYEEAMQMSYSERLAMSDLVKENLETTKKSGLPFF